MSKTLRALLSWAAVVAAALSFIELARTTLLSNRLGRMADALPLYLYAAAADAGLSPVDQANLQQVYDAREMGVGAATWSTLYPASTGVVLRPLAGLSWPQFETLWGWVLLAAAAAVGLLIPRTAPRSADRSRLMMAAGLALMAAFPATAETARLGQINMLLAALSAGALVLLARDRDLFGGLLLGLGACLKLVPAAVALPLVAGKRWRVALGGCLIGLPVLALTFTLTPPEAFIAALRETSSFQSTITPAWLVNPELPRWIWHLGFTRHTALMLLTGGAALGAALWRPSPGVLVGAGMLVLAWLGTDASVFHLLYTPLFAPAWLWVCAWALEPEAPRWTWPLSAGLALAGVFMPDWKLYAPDTTVACMLLGFMVWGGVLGRVAWEGSRATERGPLAGLFERWPLPLAATAGLLSVAVVLRVGLPDMSPIPDEVTAGPGREIVRTGAGFIDPTQAPPGGFESPGAPAHPMADYGVPQDGARRWPTMAVTGALRRGSRRPIDLHLSAAPSALRALSARLPDPTLAAQALALADSTPGGPLNQLPFQRIATWLAAEGVLLARAEALGVSDPALRASWEAAAAP